MKFSCLPLGRRVNNKVVLDFSSDCCRADGEGHEENTFCCVHYFCKGVIMNTLFFIIRTLRLRLTKI